MNEELLINEFVSTNTNITELARKYKIKINQLSDILRKHGFIFGRSANRNCVLHLKDAIADYKTGKYSLTQLHKKYNVAQCTISTALKRLGMSVINRQNEVKFNENIFDKIDTEEKAY